MCCCMLLEQKRFAQVIFGLFGNVSKPRDLGSVTSLPTPNSPRRQPGNLASVKLAAKTLPKTPRLVAVWFREMGPRLPFREILDWWNINSVWPDWCLFPAIFGHAHQLGPQENDQWSRTASNLGHGGNRREVYALANVELRKFKVRNDSPDNLVGVSQVVFS